jgi:hypothetical protein
MVSAIQYYKDQLLVVERSYSVGKQACTIKFTMWFLKSDWCKNIASLQNQIHSLKN